MSAVPELIEAAATDLAGLRSTISQATESATAATTSVLPAAADEVSALVAQLFGSHGQDFLATSARAAAFHDEFVNLLSGGAGQYAAAETAAQALLGGTAAGAPAQSIASFAATVAAPYETLFANTTANLQSLGSAVSANPMPFLRQLISNQAGYVQAAGAGFVNAIQNLPSAIANLPTYVQNSLQNLASFQPGALAQSIINNQIGYLNTISTSLQAANQDFLTGLQGLPASFQAAGQAFQAGDVNGAINNLATGFLRPFISGFTGELLDSGLVPVNPTGAVGDLMPILSIPGQMAQNFTALLPPGSIPAMISQNVTNLINTATDTSQWISLNVATLPIPLHVGLPLALGLDAIGPFITTGDAVQSSLTSFAGAVQTGNVAGAAAAVLGAPAVIANGFLNGQTMLPLNVEVAFPFGGSLNSTTYLPLGGILSPLQTGQLITDIDPGVPYPLGGSQFGGIIPGLLAYLPEQFARAIGATT
ncbi:PE family protein [Mycobacterium asiaticum]|uniref:PE domain-containing protein n=1 Tax=Mycobacterium asiaticum TaxID=1790 RepID=A0A1A3MWZ7_MYCAS|nr:PE family protein [Mycobacterium asiaticum]OBK13605.1 hypothetical protein A5636_09160 [Mycobacterium asiaticum]